MKRFGLATLALPALASLVMIGCAAGDALYTPEAPAGFWAGLWHGSISLITLIIGLFSEKVGFWELDNSGWGYETGFWLGVVIMSGGLHRGATRRSQRAQDRARDKEWEEIGKKVEVKLARMLRAWAEAAPDEEWELVQAKAEHKLKREVRKWADEP